MKLEDCLVLYCKKGQFGRGRSELDDGLVAGSGTRSFVLGDDMLIEA